MSSRHPALSDDPQAATLAAALGTQYELIRLLGRGGMGAVYLAHEPFLERHVAVKVLPAELASGDARDRFLREARTAARLSHPNIVPLHTFGQAGDLLYYLMGYVEGESLEARLRRETRLPFDDARRIVSELADALDYAHQMGVVHRDVKPDNVLLDRRTGRAILTDFGIAKQRVTRESLTATGVLLGTPHYMSPEQASGDREIDGRSDIYALGVVGYRMIAGRLPFEGAHVQDVLVQQVTRAPVPVAQTATGIPLDLSAAVTRALAKDPNERWPTARAMRESLQPGREDSMPDELHEILRVGVRMTIVALALVEIGVAVTIFGGKGKWIGAAIVSGAAMVVPALSWLSASKAVSRYGRREALRAWFLQPTWWPWWWPSFARVEGDAWSRLPAHVKRVRTIDGVAVLVMPLWINGLLAVMHAAAGSPDPLYLNKPFAWAFAILASAFVLTIRPALAYRRWARALGLSAREVRQLQLEWTGSSTFWSRPNIAAILSGAPASTDSRLRRGSADIVREVAAAARDGAASPYADLYMQAATGARALAAAIDAADVEIAQLSRDADPREHARIVASLDALGPADANESLQKGQMRDLLGRQLEILAQLDQRREEVALRRDQLSEQLHALALEVAQLRAQTALDSPEAMEITGRMRALVREIDYRVAGGREAHELLRRTAPDLNDR